MKNIYLLPNKSKIVGIILLITGLVFTYFRFVVGIKPEYLNQKVFAIYSSLLSKKYFVFTTNNIFEEVCGLLVLLGLFILAFSKEKVENNEVQNYRLYSFLYAGYANVFIVIFAYFFIYGLGFISFAMANIYLTLILFIIIFNYNLYRSKTK